MGSALAAGDAQLPFHEIDAGDGLRDRMLDLQSRVHLHEPDAIGAQPFGSIGDELDRARAFVGHRECRFDRGAAHGFASRCVHARRRRFFDHLLMAALQRAVALEQMDGVAVTVGEHLHFDVTRARDVLLDQHAIVAEAGGCFAPAGRQRCREVRCALDLAHAFAAAAGDRLDQHRKADRRGLFLQASCVLIVAQIAGRHGHAGLGHQLLGRVLEAHRANGGGGRTDPDQAGGLDGLGERRILGQEAVARMDGACAGLCAAARIFSGRR